MNKSISWLYSNTDWLYIKIFENSLFFIDYWSIVHFWSGIVLLLILSAFFKKVKWTLFLSSLLAYELFEILFLLFALDIFKPETFKDQITDIVIGALGGAAFYVISNIGNGSRIFTSIKKQLLIIFVSFSFAFVWVGNYHYHYNISCFNYSGINLWTLLLWLLEGMFILEIYIILKKYVANKIKQIVYLWLLYFSTLLLFEYIGYYSLNITEISFTKKESLIFGLIHGNLWLHLYYIFVPFLMVLFYECICIIYKRILVTK